ncbi:hypothetical protein ERO13_D12G022300v2 [Gossypium hirsutum]|uniref:Uncharacterized protein n=6 Tax=Gossypium TaxID=3633 RepID=A0A0D2SYY7_GOSRA|nr:hypothetical protein ES319_D12G023800v1 [Gossypium barbadense]KAG4114057.1 hypothetical protein ERO13_D12G022300v2 [Gossypium hirsutum]KJB47356.1 hypothetical protein B456_008G022700 [Gossypium raimondii]MBA0562118.1 hypothetical protein [Gossypium lobatum]TYG39556.1 hypothetical protein ES288_D12G024500v1 [Gossypium darwinii]TYH37211.1 hypothetical protein ES332_D12G024100v1 [Gossypium tomentosum]
MKMRKSSIISFLLLLSLLLSSMKPGAEARGLLRDSKWQYSNGSKKIQKGRFKGMFLHAVKVSGPSLGVGHRYNNLQSIEVQKSGPSPGEGHK